MKHLVELNDENILGLQGRSTKPPRRTARAIVQNASGQFAVMYARKFGLYSLPGGGIEPGEDTRTALHREIQEETGCTCDEIRELGIVSENRVCQDYTQESYYFIVTTKQEHGSTHMTASEQANETQLLWCDLPQLLSYIRDREHDTVQRKYLQARDLAALKEYIRQSALVRPALCSDYVSVEALMEQIQKLHIDLRPDIYKPCSPVLPQDEFLHAAEAGHMLIVELEGRPVGLLSFLPRHIETHFHVTRNILYIDTLVIDRQYRRLGLCKILLESIRQIAAQQHADGIELQVNARNIDALDMYRAYGFTEKSINMELL